MMQYNGFTGLATVGHVERNIEQAWPNAWDNLTGAQYGKVMSVANTSYHDGRASAGAEVESGCLVMDGCPLIPLPLLHKIRTVERTEHTYRLAKGIVACLPSGRYDEDGTPNPDGEYWREDWHITEYYIGEQLIYSEQC